MFGTAPMPYVMVCRVTRQISVFSTLSTELVCNVPIQVTKALLQLDYDGNI